MKKFFAFGFALLSGLYLLTIGVWPDPIILLDEATALLILGKSLSVLGVDISRFVPFMRRKPKPGDDKEGPIIDI